MIIKWRISQSSQPIPCATMSLAYILRAKKNADTAAHIPMPMYIARARDGGSLKSGTTPGGGVAAGRFTYCEESIECAENGWRIEFPSTLYVDVQNKAQVTVD